MNVGARGVIKLAVLAVIALSPLAAGASGDGSRTDAAAATAELRALLARGATAEAVRLGNAVKGSVTAGEGARLSNDFILLLAKGYLKLGMHQGALRLLGERIAGIPENSGELLPLLNLAGEAALLAGRLDEAEKSLEKASLLAQGGAQDRLWTNLLQAQLRHRQKRGKDALVSCRQAEETAQRIGDAGGFAYATLLRAQIVRQAGDGAQALASYREALARYKVTADSPDTVDGMISAGVGLGKLPAGPGVSQGEATAAAHEAFGLAAAMAGRLRHPRALSQSHGRWGERYEAEENLPAALRETELAVHYAQQARLADLLYAWQHQAGRILRKQGNQALALDVHRAAARNLDLLRRGLATDCSTADGSFQEKVKPVYLELAALLIDTSAVVKDRGEEQRLLLEARSTIESLRTEELRDYFEDACLGSERPGRMAFEAMPPNTALIYTVMFPDRLELLVSLPDGIKRLRAAESPSTVSREIRLLRLTIENRFPAWTTSARKLYDWILRPIEADLKRHSVHTIVFVPDGPLRNVPLTVFHDGERSIISKYAVATIQGLSFTSGGSGQNFTKSGILLAGISESVQGYPALGNVPEELKGIGETYRGVALLNSDFQVQRIKDQLDNTPYPLIHFASHGEFTGNARNNYILTWEGRMTLDHLDRFIKSSASRKTPVELLSLSACKTAAGDDRAALGLAGLAVKSGARSAVASLWDIDDKSTSELFVEFYHLLGGGGISRVEALRRAQLHIQTKYDHPYFWSPFLLIGNWL